MGKTAVTISQRALAEGPVMGFGTMCHRCFRSVFGAKVTPNYKLPVDCNNCCHCGVVTMSAIYVYVDAGKVDHPGYLSIKRRADRV